MKKTSVVILNWNGAEMLRRFLPSVVTFSKGGDVEVCVADNASTDASCEVVRKEFPSVRLVCLDRNYGFAEGYNRALQEVDAEYAVLLNSDVEVTEGWLSPLVEFMDCHPQLAACQPKILSYRNRDMFEYAGAAGGFIDRYGYPFCRGRIFDKTEKDTGQYDTPVSVFWATGAALMVRLDIYKVPESKVYHVGGATLKKENPRKTYLNFRNNLLMLYKNLPDSELHSVMRVRTLLDYVAAFAFLVKGDTADFKAVLQARRDFRRMRPLYEPVRSENLCQAVVEDISERASFSILWQSKVLRRVVFSRLPFFK